MMLKKFLILFALIFALLVPAAANADYTVSTFNELVEAVSDDESGDITLGANIVMTKAIDLDRPVTITGGGYTLIAAASRHFTISAAGVTLDGITFEGSYSGGGVSVSSSGGVTFSGTTAFNNTSADNGGAVNIAASATATFSGTATFTGNAASSSGGAIDIASGGTATFSGTAEFTGNTASSNGGAINSAGTVSFASATFTSNAASSSGGAINIASGTVTFSETPTFTGNTASSNGGAIYSAGSLSFASATFGGTDTADSNKATNGGAIYATGSLSFTGAATFTTNVASGDGGAIYSTAAVSFASTTETPRFTGNTAEGSGGAIYATGEVSFASGATFGGSDTADSNTAGANGGAIYSTSTVKFTSTTATPAFSNNSAAGSGGAINAAGGTVSFANTATFTGNKANSNGGAINIASGTTVEFTSTTTAPTFTDNTAGSGGAIYSIGTTTFANSAAFATNVASADGGAINAAGGTVSFANTTTFTSNTASANGGAINAAGGTVSFTKTATFTGNTAGDGGAIYLDNSSSTRAFEFDDKFIFSENKTTTELSSSATGHGGAVYATGLLTLSGASFDVNEAAGSGGAVYAAGNINVTGGEFTDNTAGSSGGAVYSGGTVTITDLDFTTTNTANGSGSNEGGGAIWANAVVIEASETLTFSNQAAPEGKGGAIYSVTSLTAENVIFDNNEAASGGAVYIGEGAELENVNFISNRSSIGGGAIYSQGNSASSIKITHSLFSDNQAAQNGGAVLLGNSKISLELQYSYFINNEAGGSGSNGAVGGGALYLSPVGRATIESCTFNSNKVSFGDTSSGGAIYIANTSSSSIENCTFYGNYANNAANENGGSALYLTGSETVIVSFCTFTGNGTSSASATALGGAIFVNNGLLRIIGTLAVGNTGIGDVYLSLDSGGSITSDGYNRIGTLAAGSSGSNGYINWDSNNVGTNAGNDISSSSWTFADFFGEETLKSNYSTQIAGTGDDAVTIPTLALDESNPNATKAVDGARSLSSGTVIPNSSCPNKDERGVSRFSNAGAAPDIGAYETSQTAGDDDSNPYADYTIKSIELSGIPNTLSIVGQTAILHATVTYINGTRTTTAEPLTWHSDNTNVAVFESSSSGAIYTKSIGEATITVSARDGAYSDSAKIYVIWEQEDTNIHPNVMNLVNQLNLQLDNDNINFYIMANAPDDANLLTDKKFTSEFQKAYNSKPSFADYDSNNFSSNSSFSRAAKSGLKDSFTPGINTALNNQYAGLLLPVFCTWEFEFADLADEFNIDEEELYSMSDAEFSSWLFKNINIGFARTNGNFLPAVSSSNQSSLQSASKAKAKAAASSSSGALSVNRGGDSVTVSMRAYLANVTPNGSEGSSLISDSTGTKRLIIPAGSNPISNTANISGTIWTTKLASSSSNNSDSDSDSSSGSGKKSGGGGGGGCSSLNLNLIALILLALLFNRKHA